MISTAKHSWEQCWGRSFDGQGSCQQQSLTSLNFHFFWSSSIGYLLGPKYDGVHHSSPHLPYPNMNLPEFWALQSEQSYGETNFIVSATKRLKHSKLLFCYQSKGKNFIPTLAPDYQGYFTAAPRSTPQGAIHIVLYVHRVPWSYGVQYLHGWMQGVPAPTPPNGKGVHHVKTSDLNFDEYLVKHGLHWPSAFTLYFQLELQGKAPCWPRVSMTETLPHREVGSLWQQLPSDSQTLKHQGF